MNTPLYVPTETRPVSRAALFLLLLAGGQLIFVFASPYFAVFPTNDNTLFSAALVAAFGLLALAFRQRPSLAHYAPPVYALFVAAAANLALVIGPFNRFLSATEPYQVMAEDKIAQFLSIVPVLVILSWLARRDLGWIYVQRGRPRRWLPFGLASLAVCAVVMVAMLLWAGARDPGERVVPPLLLEQERLLDEVERRLLPRLVAEAAVLRQRLDARLGRRALPQVPRDVVLEAGELAARLLRELHLLARRERDVRPPVEISLGHRHRRQPGSRAGERRVHRAAGRFACQHREQRHAAKAVRAPAQRLAAGHRGPYVVTGHR